jgi:hypothetical protein
MRDMDKEGSWNMMIYVCKCRVVLNKINTVSASRVEGY